MFNFVSLIGLIDILLAFIYTILSRTRFRSAFREFFPIALYNVQSLVMPFFLVMIGVILLLLGWRLDPILQFAFLVSNFIILYLVSKDIIILNLISNNRMPESFGIILYILQTIATLIMLGLSLLIMLFQGWRVDSVLRFSALLQTLLIIYLVVKDIYILSMYEQRKSRK